MEGAGLAPQTGREDVNAVDATGDAVLVFQMLPAGLTATCEVARRDENKGKNRYGNIIACTATFLLLSSTSSSSSSSLACWLLASAGFYLFFVFRSHAL